MADEDHPFIASCLKRAVVPIADRQQGGQHITANLTLYDHDTRAAVIDGVDDAMQADDGASLRQKAQLLNLRRQLSDAHTALKIVGR